ncbi:hypothetical protein SARC_17542, partial [Sphaeroforma arctica JP610]
DNAKAEDEYTPDVTQGSEVDSYPSRSSANNINGAKSKNSHTVDMSNQALNTQ